MSSNTSVRIAIASGKGGTGKTLFATNLFYSLQQHGREATLIDCDAEGPNDMLFFSGKLQITHDVTQKVPVIDEEKCTYCGACHEYCNYHAIFILPTARIIKVLDDLCHGCGACSVACQYEAISEKETSLGLVNQFAISASSTIIESRMHTGVYSPVAVIKAAIRAGSHQQQVIMDAPPGTSCPFIHTAVDADYVILVTEPTPFGLSDLRQSVAVLKSMNKPCGVVVNRADMGDRQVYSYLEDEGLPLLMEIPFSREIAATYSRGKLWAGINTAFNEDLYQLYQHILFRYGNSPDKR